MTALDPANSLQHYPLAMARFGVNPFGENRFRIVLANSRRSLVHGQWNGAGTPRAKYCQTYPHIPGEDWILEEWLSASLFAGMTAEQWNSDPNMLSLGPYPHRGEYQMCGNCGFHPDHLNIEKLIALVHAGDRYSWSEKLVACRNQATKDEIDRRCLREAIIRDALPSFGHAPFVAYGGRGGGRKSRVEYSANELGLPIPQGIPGQATSGGARVVPKRKRKAA